jgi:hypothetical protein
MEDIHPLVWPFIIWGSLGLTIFALCWPALWVEPIRSVRAIVGGAIGYADRGHEAPLFFNGSIVEGDPGALFYPITYLWRTTPVVLIGLVLAAVSFAVPRPEPAETSHRRATALLALSAGLFILFMSLGAKKFDRYLLPVYAPLDLVAAIGWLAAAHWLKRSLYGVARAAAPALIGVAVAGQAGSAYVAFPYYFSYYNPLLGGTTKAPEVMMIGWGEGLDQAARYLNAMPRAEQLRVTTWFWNGTFSYFFNGQSLPGQFNPDPESVLQWVTSDYCVLYINQRQRGRLPPELLAYLDGLTPVRTVRIHGLEYAWIYDIRDAPFPDYLLGDHSHLTDWGGTVRLVTYTLSERPLVPGQEVEVTFYLQNLAPPTHDLSMLVRVLDSEGREVQRSDGLLTPAAQPRVVRPVVRRFPIPADTTSGPYRIELSIYDRVTRSPLPATNAHSGAPLGDAVVIDSLVGSHTHSLMSASEREQEER